MVIEENNARDSAGYDMDEDDVNLEGHQEDDEEAYYGDDDNYGDDYEYDDGVDEDMGDFS